MKRVIQNERGMALALAIVALVVVGALIAGAFFAGTQEQRVGENARYSQRSFGVAEGATNYLIGHWNPQVYNRSKAYPLDSVKVPTLGADTVSPSHTGRYAGYVYRLNSELYLIDLTGQDSTTLAAGGAFRRRGGGGRERIGLLARIKPLVVDIRASLTTGKSDIVAGNAVVDGNDHVPVGWETQCAPKDTINLKAGIRADLGATITEGGSSDIVGTPPWYIDPNIGDSTFSKFGDVTYAQLASRATLTLGGGQNFANDIYPRTTATGQCDYANPHNWGDGVNPGQPCGSYFPIVHILGNAQVNGTQGQGILLVDGSLVVNGGFQWFGITIIRGTLNTAGGGSTDAHFWGAVMAQDSVVVGSNTISGHANLNYSKCAILKALDSTGMVAIMRSRGWVQLY
ncbi:MAG: hypothetical protein DMD55_08210 [Gemmatimonadetes bacterium]|nr:MAG: hypothetical protein DMD55_08210 [Gemmatimonadota bacterium]